jgi:hypothetical protein
MVENRRHQEGGQRRIAARGFLRLAADAREHRIVAAQSDHAGRGAMRHESLHNRSTASF